ncbi:hypothetical protein [Streptococcus oricebi]|uniref:Lipoprotein n=1 Tax=Streptococcus oricebi TaxID=1547447 RepID=A0ABS5B1N0_9STRE|nr:hypothetical protein [Streptococcus oricebi]MBP2622734.1 hypothetical protein [Streptococcus oricebi]
MKKSKSIILLVIFSILILIGGLIVTRVIQQVTSGGFDRAKIEKQLDYMSEVYPTPKVSDLFKKFPKGFEIKYVLSDHSKAAYTGGKDIDHFIILTGKSETKEIQGVYYQEERKVDDEVRTEEISIRYTEDGGIVKLDGTPVNEKVSQIKFLFTNLTLNKEILSTFKIRSYFKNPVSGDDEITYIFKDSWVSKQLSASKETELDINFTYLQPSSPYLSMISLSSGDESLFEIIDAK